jgi:hypothetical protein
MIKKNRKKYDPILVLEFLNIFEKYKNYKAKSWRFYFGKKKDKAKNVFFSNLFFHFLPTLHNRSYCSN